MVSPEKAKRENRRYKARKSARKSPAKKRRYKKSSSVKKVKPGSSQDVKMQMQRELNRKSSKAAVELVKKYGARANGTVERD